MSLSYWEVTNTRHESCHECEEVASAAMEVGARRKVNWVHLSLGHHEASVSFYGDLADIGTAPARVNKEFK